MVRSSCGPLSGQAAAWYRYAQVVPGQAGDGGGQRRASYGAIARRTLSLFQGGLGSLGLKRFAGSAWDLPGPPKPI